MNRTRLSSTRLSTTRWLAILLVTTGLTLPLQGQSPLADDTIEWRHYAADRNGSKYSAAEQIDKTNVSELEIAWRAPSPDRLIDSKKNAMSLKGTPLFFDQQLVTVSSYGITSGHDPATGKVLWRFDPKAYELEGLPTHGGFSQRGLETWNDGKTTRIVLTTGMHQMVSLDALTGEPIGEFGKLGMVDMRADVATPEELRLTGQNSPAILCGNSLIVGMTMNDFASSQKMPKGDVRAYDKKTGKRTWTFHTVPREGEFGAETWQDESWKKAGNTNVWSMMSCDEERDLVYLPTATPTSDYYGGHRPGDNLFAEALVALDANTGERKWHFQAVHHGIWDYDFPCAPNLLDVEIGGETVPIVAQVSKQGYTYVFNRVTGEPIWPIEERPVAKSTVPGEWTAPTQPFPTKPPPFETLGVLPETLNNLTPELHKEALEIVEDFVIGPLFTPPIVAGADGKKAMLQHPGQAGGANWGGAAHDPETGVLYVVSQSRLGSMSLTKPGPRARSDRDYLPAFVRPEGPQGLPLMKPPWSRVTAIDLKQGDFLWQEPLGDGPKDHPALKGLDLPRLGTPYISGLSPGFLLLTKTLLFVGQAEPEGQGAAGRARGAAAIGFLRAFDKDNGALIWEAKLPGPITGSPMTYVFEGKQYIVIPLGNSKDEAEWVAYALPVSATDA